MAIKINWQDLLKRFINWQEIVRVYKNGGQIRPETVPPIWWDYLCFTAEQSNSTVGLGGSGSSTPQMSLEISYDKTTWMDYNLWWIIALSNVWDKVYFRNKSETPVLLNYESWPYYRFFVFRITWYVAASWDVNYLLCKYSTTTIPWANCFKYLFSGCTGLTTAPKLTATTLTAKCYDEMFNWCTDLRTPPVLPATTMADECYYEMFKWCTWLVSAPELPATNLASRCYLSMFYRCTSLNVLPRLPATNLAGYCYADMFSGCSSIKLSETQTWEYQTPYRIPSSWTWVDASYSMSYMFYSTWWTFTRTPSINTTYYTSNQVI